MEDKTMPSSVKAYKGLGMEGGMARWYDKITRRDMPEFARLAARIGAHVPPAGSVLEVAPRAWSAESRGGAGVLVGRPRTGGVKAGGGQSGQPFGILPPPQRSPGAGQCALRIRGCRSPAGRGRERRFCRVPRGIQEFLRAG